MGIGFAYAIGAAITWGLVYTIDQKILINTSPIVLLFIDSIITMLIMLPFALYSRIEIKNVFASGWQNIGLIIFTAVLAVLAGYLIFMSIKMLGASMASVIEIAYPFFVVLFTLIIFRTAPGIYFYIGALLIFVGSALIAYFH